MFNILRFSCCHHAHQEGSRSLLHGKGVLIPLAARLPCPRASSDPVQLAVRTYCRLPSAAATGDMLRRRRCHGRLGQSSPRHTLAVQVGAGLGQLQRQADDLGGAWAPAALMDCVVQVARLQRHHHQVICVVKLQFSGLLYSCREAGQLVAPACMQPCTTLMCHAACSLGTCPASLLASCSQCPRQHRWLDGLWKRDG